MEFFLFHRYAPLAVVSLVFPVSPPDVVRQVPGAYRYYHGRRYANRLRPSSKRRDRLPYPAIRYYVQGATSGEDGWKNSLVSVIVLSEETYESQQSTTGLVQKFSHSKSNGSFEIKKPTYSAGSQYLHRVVFTVDVKWLAVMELLNKRPASD